MFSLEHPLHCLGRGNDIPWENKAMRLFLLGLLAVSLLPLQAMADSIALHSVESTTTINGRSVSQIDGKSPEDFFAQFQYAVTKSKLSGQDEHQIVGAGLYRYQSKIDLGKGKWADVRIALYKDGTVDYEYSEWKQLGPNAAHREIARTGHTKSKIQDNKLIIEGVGEARGAVLVATDNAGKETKTPVLSFLFTEDIHSPGISNGRGLVLSRYGSAFSPKEYKDEDNSIE